MTPATVRVPIGKIDGRIKRRQEDLLAVEKPLEIRVASRSSPRTNILEVELSTTTVIKAPPPQRGFMMTSACGLCGKVSLESLAANRCPVLPPGLHAAALFNPQGELDSLREDVGRHNAVDKLVGHALLRFRTPLDSSVMLVSGRASFELVQKASMAGVPLLAAVGAPSSHTRDHPSLVWKPPDQGSYRVHWVRTRSEPGLDTGTWAEHFEVCRRLRGFSSNRTTPRDQRIQADVPGVRSTRFILRITISSTSRTSSAGKTFNRYARA